MCSPQYARGWARGYALRFTDQGGTGRSGVLVCRTHHASIAVSRLSILLCVRSEGSQIWHQKERDNRHRTSARSSSTMVNGEWALISDRGKYVDQCEKTEAWLRVIYNESRWLRHRQSIKPLSGSCSMKQSNDLVDSG